MFSPLLAGTEYFFVYNKTDSSAEILEVHKLGVNKRLLAFHKKKRESKMIRAFLNREIYNNIKSQLHDLLENELPNKSQPHISVDLKTMWNMLCVLTNKQTLITK